MLQVQRAGGLARLEAVSVSAHFSRVHRQLLNKNFDSNNIFVGRFKIWTGGGMKTFVVLCVPEFLTNLIL